MTTAKKSQFSGLAGIVNKKPAEKPAEQIDLESAISLTPPPEKPRAGRAVGKSANPDYERMTVYVRKETKKAAERKCEDEGQFPDVSELVQSLLTNYLNS